MCAFIKKLMQKSKQRRAFINPAATMIGVFLLFLSTLMFATATYVGWRWIGYLGVLFVMLGVLFCFYDGLFLANIKRLRRANKTKEPHDKVD